MDLPATVEEKLTETDTRESTIWGPHHSLEYASLMCSCTAYLVTQFRVKNTYDIS